MPSPESLVLLASGAFFWLGLVCGAWKYKLIRESADARAPEYVNIAHRTALMYAFSCLLLAKFVTLSQLPHWIEWICVWVLLGYFFLAQFSYVVHGLLRDTENQLRRPHRLGAWSIPDKWMTWFMVSLAVGEILAFSVLLWGATRLDGRLVLHAL